VCGAAIHGLLDKHVRGSHPRPAIDVPADATFIAFARTRRAKVQFAVVAAHETLAADQMVFRVVNAALHTVVLRRIVINVVFIVMEPPVAVTAIANARVSFVTGVSFVTAECPILLLVARGLIVVILLVVRGEHNRVRTGVGVLCGLVDDRHRDLFLFCRTPSVSRRRARIGLTLGLCGRLRSNIIQVATAGLGFHLDVDRWLRLDFDPLVHNEYLQDELIDVDDLIVVRDVNDLFRRRLYISPCEPVFFNCFTFCLSTL